MRHAWRVAADREEWQREILENVAWLLVQMWIKGDYNVQGPEYYRYVEWYVYDDVIGFIILLLNYIACVALKC